MAEEFAKYINKERKIKYENVHFLSSKCVGVSNISNLAGNKNQETQYMCCEGSQLSVFMMPISL